MGRGLWVAGCMWLSIACNMACPALHQAAQPRPKHAPITQEQPNISVLSVPFRLKPEQREGAVQC